ncbi:GyrI-like domain-containing protein [Flagellimonas sp. S3867]|uniref:AraC family transcriptional regulator n=1 Tax=Flagellimonas sp. S3867 TaxID=2768063 RepID=UPI0016832A35|nr:GyrI-like domain-containing protein [Flagellimonas sp. S3867]
MEATTALKVEIKEFPERTLAYISHTGPYKGDAELFGKLFTKALDWIQTEGLANNPKMETITVYHDSETVPIDQQRISVGYTINEDREPNEEIKMLTLPKGKYLVGSFEILPTEYETAWFEIFDYLKTEKLTLSDGPMYESYKNDPTQHPEGKHIVDICLALKN